MTEEKDTSTKEQEQVEETRIVMVFTGMLQNVKHQTRYGYHIVPDADDLTKHDDRELIWAKRLFRGRPGTVMSVRADVEEDGFSVYYNTGIFEGWWGVPEEVMKWQAENDAIETVKKQEKLAKKNVIKEQCEPMKDAYWQLSPAKRRAFLTQIIQYVTNPN